MAVFPLATGPLKGKRLPWWISLKTLPPLVITNYFPPTNIEDTQGFVYTATEIPGLEYTPETPNHGQNRTLSFSLPIIQRHDFMGNSRFLQQLDILREQNYDIFKAIAGARFTLFEGPPHVLYNYGTGQLYPLTYQVNNISYSTEGGAQLHQLGYCEFTITNWQLTLVPDKLYQAHRLARQVGAIAAAGESIAGQLGAISKGRRNY